MADQISRKNIAIYQQLVQDSSEKVTQLQTYVEKLEIQLNAEQGRVKMLEKEIEFNDKKFLTDMSNLKLENDRLRQQLSSDRDRF